MCKIFSNMKFFLSTHLQLYILHNPFNLYLLRLFICANLSFVCYEFLLYTFFCSYLTQQSVANPQPVPDCGPGATPPAFAGVTEPVVSAIRSRSLSQESPAAARPRRNRAPAMPERGQRRRVWAQGFAFSPRRKALGGQPPGAGQG